MQTTLSLTQVSALLQDPSGNPSPIGSLGSAATAPYTLAWRFVPAAEGSYRLTVAAHELLDPFVKSIGVQSLPFNSQQDYVLSSSTLGEATLITYVLSSPMTLTDLSAIVSDSIGTALTTTLALSNFDAGRYNFAWQFTAEASGWHTVTLNADEIMQLFVRRIRVIASQVFLPIVLRNFERGLGRGTLAGSAVIVIPTDAKAGFAQRRLEHARRHEGTRLHGEDLEGRADGIHTCSA